MSDVESYTRREFLQLTAGTLAASMTSPWLATPAKSEQPNLHPISELVSVEAAARWIWHSRESQPNTWCCFRRTFRLKEKMARAPTRIAVDSKYWLWVNGRLVVREGGLKRGPTPRDTYVDEVDLAAHLKEGENTVAVLVWYFGHSGS
ncbi:MAG: glycoside hydrolase family 78, partial [Armatimonadota bacterium]|nr:glycoside hydrolase family 78 [Armatimonadota bacterium]